MKTAYVAHDSHNPDDVIHGQQLRQCLTFEPSLRTILYTAKLIGDAAREEQGGMRWYFDITAPKVLQYKGIAIASVQQTVSKAITKEDFSAMAYGLNLLIFTEVSGARELQFKHLHDIVTGGFHGSQCNGCSHTRLGVVGREPRWH